MTLEECYELVSGPQDYVSVTAPLQAQDYALIGEFIQQYCWVDFNARRAVNRLRAINHDLHGDYAATLNDTEILRQLDKEAGQIVGKPAVTNILQDSYNTFKRHQVFRHTFAHWGVRRVKDEEVFVACTTNKKEAGKRKVNDLQVGSMALAVFAIDDVARELDNLKAYGEALAKATGYLFQDEALSSAGAAAQE